MRSLSDKLSDVFDAFAYGFTIASMVALFFAALVWFTASVKADELSLIAGSFSHHLATDTEYNEDHHSAGLKYTSDSAYSDRGFNRTSHNLFRFINSYDSVGVAYMYQRSGCREAYLTFCVGWAVGGTTEYDEQGWPVMPVAGLTADVATSYLNINVMYVPIANVLTFQLDTPIWRF